MTDRTGKDDHGRARLAGPAFFDALVALLDPDVVLRADTAAGLRVVRGAEAVAGNAFAFRQLSPFSRPALVNGAPGLVTASEGRPVSIMGFTVTDGLIVEIDILADPERLARIDLTPLGD